MQMAAGNPFQQIQKTGNHFVDPVGLSQPRDSISAATRASGSLPQMHRPQAGICLLGSASTAFEDAEVAKPFGKRSVHPMQALTAFATTMFHESLSL
jgi:hypothetical protein